MSFLLDTHAFIWSVLEHGRLGRRARAALTDPSSDVFMSAVSFRKISLKIAQKNPFDRMLIWQTIRGGHTLVARDTDNKCAYRSHKLATLW